jgi:uncharacterized protein Yka (UPF0111/DUF47 family)
MIRSNTDMDKLLDRLDNLTATVEMLDASVSKLADYYDNAAIGIAEGTQSLIDAMESLSSELEEGRNLLEACREEYSGVDSEDIVDDNDDS